MYYCRGTIRRQHYHRAVALQLTQSYSNIETNRTQVIHVLLTTVINYYSYKFQIMIVCKRQHAHFLISLPQLCM